MLISLLAQSLEWWELCLVSYADDCLASLYFCRSSPRYYQSEASNANRVPQCCSLCSDDISTGGGARERDYVLSAYSCFSFGVSIVDWLRQW